MSVNTRTGRVWLIGMLVWPLCWAGIFGSAGILGSIDTVCAQEKAGRGESLAQESTQQGASKTDNQKQNKSKKRPFNRPPSVVTTAPSSVGLETAKPGKNETFVLTPTAKRELQQFVRDNHPQLERLLLWLEDKRPGQYEKAVRSLYKTQNRLNTLKHRDPDKYLLSLEHWKVKSRIQLVAAELAIEDSAERKQQLRELVAKEIQLRSQQLKMEAARFSDRLQRINAQIDRLDNHQAQEVQRQMELAVKATKRLVQATQRASRSSDKKKRESSPDKDR